MISPELLRRFSFFNFLNDAQLKAVAMIAEEVRFAKEAVIVETNQPAHFFYFLIQGDISYFHIVTTEHDPSYRREYHVYDIGAGEVFGISALVEPYVYTSTLRANSVCTAIKINAPALRALCEVDPHLSYGLMKVVAKAAMERLHNVRISARVDQS
jgi:CRP-like cAMP-binding protein